MAGELWTLNIRDYSKELSSFSVRVGAVTAGTLPGLLSDINDLRTATDAVILGVQARDQLTAYKTTLSNAIPTDANAQRERKWLVTYADNTAFFDAPTNSIPNEGFGKIFQIEIPTADLAGVGLLLPNSDEANLANAAWVAWIAAFEAVGRSPHGGVPEVLGIQAVGRNV